MPINDPEKSENMRKSIRVYSGSSNRPSLRRSLSTLGSSFRAFYAKAVRQR